MQAQLREQRSTFAWSQGLLILQIGAAVVLLAAAAVLARALTELRTTEAGFTVNNVALVTLVTQPGGTENRRLVVPSRAQPAARGCAGRARGRLVDS